jgi:hypothetical protein
LGSTLPELAINFSYAKALGGFPSLLDTTLDADTFDTCEEFLVTSASAVVVDFCTPIKSILKAGSILAFIGGLGGCFVTSELSPTTEE